MLSKHITVKEYESSSVKGGYEKSISIKMVNGSRFKSSLEVNFLKLSVAMIKANTKINSGVFYQAYDIMINALLLFGLLDCKSSSVFLRDGFRVKYRDFSRSSRTGELGQAISYIFSQEVLGYKYVFDFDEFLRSNLISSKNRGGRPDYVLLGAKNKNVAVLESKGSCCREGLTGAVLRTKLQKAMDNQCLLGVGHLQGNNVRVSNSYASVVELSETSDERDSFIHFADPEYDDFEEQDYSEAIKNFYARWLAFLLRRQDDNSFSVENMKSSDEFDVLEYQGERYYVQKEIYRTLNLVVPVSYGISSKVLDYILVEDYGSIYRLDIKAFSSENVEIFSDGTIALRRV